MEHQENAHATTAQGGPPEQAAPPASSTPVPADSAPAAPIPPQPGTAQPGTAQPAAAAAPAPAPAEPAVTTCYRHPDRECYVRCTRCERVICPDCMRAASVGFHCPDCVRSGVKTQRKARTVFGGRIAGGPPVATMTLIMLNVVAYVAELSNRALIDRFSAWGRGYVDSGISYVWQGAVPPGDHAAGIAHGEWYRLLTSAFLHEPPASGFGLLHILFNMMWLWQLGPVMEAQLGRVRFVALYLVAAIGGSTAAYLIAPDTPAIGASGAIFGLVGGYWVMSRRLRHDPLGGNGLLVMFIVSMVVMAGVTSWQGHLGGLLSGLAVGVGFAFAPRGKARAWVQAGAVVLVLAVLVGLVVWQTTRIGAI